jgi:hypothetical protein
MCLEYLSCSAPSIHHVSRGSCSRLLDAPRMAPADQRRSRNRAIVQERLDELFESPNSGVLSDGRSANVGRDGFAFGPDRASTFSERLSCRLNTIHLRDGPHYSNRANARHTATVSSGSDVLSTQSAAAVTFTITAVMSSCCASEAPKDRAAR